MTPQFFQDIVTGETVFFDPYTVDQDEMLAFNKKWDDLPIHVNAEAARSLGHKGIIASGQFTLCIKQFFVNQVAWRDSAIGAAGWDEVRFTRPVYAGDKIAGSFRYLEKIESKSKPDRGIIKFEIILTNQDGDIVLSLVDSVMIKKREE